MALLQEIHYNREYAGEFPNDMRPVLINGKGKEVPYLDFLLHRLSLACLLSEKYSQIVSSSCRLVCAYLLLSRRGAR